MKSAGGLCSIDSWCGELSRVWDDAQRISNYCELRRTNACRDLLQRRSFSESSNWIWKPRPDGGALTSMGGGTHQTHTISP